MHRWPGPYKQKKMNHLEMATVLGKINQGLPTGIKVKGTRTTPVLKKKREFPEQKTQKQIISWLRMHGAACGKIEMRGREIMGRHIKDPDLFVGFPDLACFYNNRFWFIEVKAGANKLRPEQEKFRELCLDAGINHIVAYKLSDIFVILEPINP